MKKLIAVALISIGLMGCRDTNTERVSSGYVVNSLYSPLKIVILDSCEYFYGNWGNATVLTHKGNCSNPIHKYDSLCGVK